MQGWQGAMPRGRLARSDTAGTVWSSTSTMETPSSATPIAQASGTSPTAYAPGGTLSGDINPSRLMKEDNKYFKIVMRLITHRHTRPEHTYTSPKKGETTKLGTPMHPRPD